MALEILLVILGLLLALIGLVGSILPVIPGPPLSYSALLLLSLARNWEPFSTAFLIGMGILTLAVTVLDFVTPGVGASRYGASTLAFWGSLVGMIVGLVLLPPWGMIIGAFLGAVAGEAVSTREGKKLLRAAWGVFVGVLVGTGLKLALSAVMLFFYLRELL
jgi:uncharacterized protein YqgC (DUF456 family)